MWDPTFEEWRYGKCKNVSREPNSWEELHSAKQIDVSITVERVIRHLRDSLAHGIICTLGDKEIDKILLLTGTKEEAWFLLVTPSNPGKFLRKWIGWLQTLDVSIWKKNNSRL